jgi:tetratricopeptide (TPR) repeat protein
MQQILAFGAERFPLDPKATFSEREERSRIMLHRALNLRTTIAFVGSGCSSPLGYPSWLQLVRDVIGFTISQGGWDGETMQRLRAFEKRLRRPVVARNVIFYLGFCQTLLDRNREGRFHSYIASRIKEVMSGVERDGAHNPYRALKTLPIQRYITTNYDHELEQMLKETPEVGEPLSFTQKTDDHGKLAGFAVVGIPALRHAVFHCHGSCEDKSSIVASESDYQRWYLQQRDAAATTFRQSLDLLLNSNPVLFVGYGMEDDDLLRPLRAFRADNPERKGSRLLFALSEFDRHNKEQRDWMDSVHERYGVNFLTYRRPKTDDPRARGNALHDEILNLRDEWHEGTRQWTRKPIIRRASVPVSALEEEKRSHRPYFHYSVDMRKHKDLAPAITAADVTKLREEIERKGNRIIVVTGDGGAGKSWRVLKLLESMKKKRGDFKGIFFWSSYYADDWLTGLDRALSYFESEGGQRPKTRRLERFRKCLRSGRHLLVFDGFERLLRETGNPKLGIPYSQSVKELLEIMAEQDDDTESTVILTSRLMPQPLLELPDERKWGNVFNFKVNRLTTADLRAGSVFKSLKEDDLARICSLCAGHSYALQLAARYLVADGSPDIERLDTFQREIARRAPDSRNSEIIKLAIDAVDEETGGLGQKLLERLAVFMSPVDSHTLDICFKAAIRDRSKPQRRSRVFSQRKVVGALIDAKLLLRVQTEPRASGRGVPVGGWLTVHPIVRSHVFTRSHGVASDAMPNFALAGFTSGSAACHPGDRKEATENIEKLLQMLCDRALDETNPYEKRRSLVRAAYGVMRSRMESNTVPRWTRYDHYIQLGLRLRYVLTQLAGRRIWDYNDREYALRQQREDGILYPDELAWLYNDIGLALASEGSMADAYSLWEQGFEIDRVTDSEEEGGQYIVQSHLHMSHLFIELGRLRRAAQFLSTTERANAIYGDGDFAGRIKGFRGLLAHLSGNVDEADKLYGMAIKQLTTDDRRNLRAGSVFHRYWADLMIFKGQLDDAEKYAELALSLAREGNFPDLEAYARKSRAHVWRNRNRHDPRLDPRVVRVEYNVVMDLARKFGIKRLQADIHSELARLALDVGDWETARIRAMDSLMLANELSLGLRRTHALIVLGRAMDAAGNKTLAISYLQHAWALSQLQGYHLRGRDAERLLQALGASTVPEPDGKRALVNL